MTNYTLRFTKDWNKYFKKLDKSVREKIVKKIRQLKTKIYSRHLRYGLDYFVVEVGQYRICFKTDEKRKVKIVCFAGTHKDYKKWLRQR